MNGVTALFVRDFYGKSDRDLSLLTLWNKISAVLMCFEG